MQRVDFVATINELKMKLENLFRLLILLFHLIAMPIVRPILSCNAKLLERELTSGYRDGAAMFYVSTTNEVVRLWNSPQRIWMLGIQYGRRKMILLKSTWHLSPNSHFLKTQS